MARHYSSNPCCPMVGRGLSLTPASSRVGIGRVQPHIINIRPNRSKPVADGCQAPRAPRAVIQRSSRGRRRGGVNARWAGPAGPHARPASSPAPCIPRWGQSPGAARGTPVVCRTVGTVLFPGLHGPPCAARSTLAAAGTFRPDGGSAAPPPVLSSVPGRKPCAVAARQGRTSAAGNEVSRRARRLARAAPGRHARWRLLHATPPSALFLLVSGTLRASTAYRIHALLSVVCVCCCWLASLVAPPLGRRRAVRTDAEPPQPNRLLLPAFPAPPRLPSRPT